jgi:hypothetical protein
MVGYSGFEKPASAAWSIVQAQAIVFGGRSANGLCFHPFVRQSCWRGRARRQFAQTIEQILNRLQQFGYVSRRINPPQRPRRSDAHGRQGPAGAILFENSQTQGPLQKPMKIGYISIKSNM